MARRATLKRAKPSAVRLLPHRELDGRSGAVQVDLVGCGGSGSLMLMRLVRIDTALKAFGHPGLAVRCWDPDEVSDANIGRQAFLPTDVGRNKAHALVERINAYFGLSWASVGKRYAGSQPHILVSCVDTHAARLTIRPMIGNESDSYWLDLGNSERTGQVILGEVSRWNYRFRLPTVIDLFGDKAPSDEDTTPSCSLQEALSRQDLFINELVVAWASDLLWKLFRDPSIAYCAVFIDALSGTARPLAIDPAQWSRFGHRTPRTKARYRAT